MPQLREALRQQQQTELAELESLDLEGVGIEIGTAYSGPQWAGRSIREQRCSSINIRQTEALG